MPRKGYISMADGVSIQDIIWDIPLYSSTSG